MIYNTLQPEPGDQIGTLLAKILLAIEGKDISYVSVPTNSAASGSPGQISTDGTYLYFYGTTGWLRVAGSTF